MPAAARAIPALKMHGTHNEFILIDERPPQVEDYEALARRVCDRTSGWGADGLLVLSEESGAAARMRIINADGSEAEMCGNGVRCAARYLAERGAGERFTIATLAGPIEAAIVARAPEFSVRIDVGAPSFPGELRAETLAAAGKVWTFYAVSLGNPHVVVFVDDVAAVDLLRAGAELATHPHFPHGTNVHFVQVLGPSALRVRHYERGVGPTQACGTGAVASAVAAIRVHGTRSPVAVDVPGGRLEVAWEPGAHATLTGPAEVVFERTLEL
ncbi:MAG: diaminopimelate epimerase [Candidatus Baltobacteraceae bacterium]|jgi:diaminopimelate epimerase